MSESDAGTFELPESTQRFFAMLGEIATDEHHPYATTAATVLFLLIGKMPRRFLHEDDFVNSPEMTALLAVLAPALQGGSTPDSLRQWIVDIVEVVPQEPITPAETKAATGLTPNELKEVLEQATRARRLKGQN